MAVDETTPPVGPQDRLERRVRERHEDTELVVGAPLILASATPVTGATTLTADRHDGVTGILRPLDDVVEWQPVVEGVVGETRELRVPPQPFVSASTPERLFTS